MVGERLCGRKAHCSSVKSGNRWWMSRWRMIRN